MYVVCALSTIWHYGRHEVAARVRRPRLLRAIASAGSPGHSDLKILSFINHPHWLHYGTVSDIKIVSQIRSHYPLYSPECSRTQGIFSAKVFASQSLANSSGFIHHWLLDCLTLIGYLTTPFCIVLR